MINKSFNYIVLLQVCSRNHFLLWQNGGNAPDKYALQPGTSFFLTAKTVEELLDRAAKLNFQVADPEPDVMDIDRLFRVLAALRPERVSSTKTCEFLLNGWNTLEDMARSIGVPIDSSDLGEKESLRVAYDKLFYGNNIPAVTPDGQKYNPLFTSSERRSMRGYLRRLWHEITERSGQFSMNGGREAI